MMTDPFLIVVCKLMLKMQICLRTIIIIKVCSLHISIKFFFAVHNTPTSRDDDEMNMTINKFPYLSMMMARYVRAVIDSELSLHSIIKLENIKREEKIKIKCWNRMQTFAFTDLSLNHSDFRVCEAWKRLSYAFCKNALVSFTQISIDLLHSMSIFINGF